ncbi:dienelactone hydrolase family protein [Iamia majanohamensis]|uniref:Dienelactone hydrolase family protein n=1 Tax=Iamia majanohamensis TaxID=467976 RepID=A0AAF0BUW3_9ACTN|nr:dienelactone hydrolase family protein [Iamia majanohamensis]WCO66488.1 dienelactone hydrolase family protein [Iamia majanohamensis]
MAAPAVDLDGFTRTDLTHDGATRTVYRAGEGPGVVVLAELPGITPDVLAFARRVVDLGCSVAVPQLFGVPGQDPARGGPRTMALDAARSIVPACVSREFTVLATGRTSPVMDWLRALGRDLHERCGGPGIGVVGMCFTGGFALGMLADAPVLAPVLSQPSLPFGTTAKAKADLGLSPEDLEAALDTCAARDLEVLGLRFTGDPLSPPERFATLRRLLGDRFVGVEIDSSPGNPWGHRKGAHSVLTLDLVDEEGQPTRDALDRVLELFRTRLLGA